jgi:AraC-like DNA-binding protein
MNNEITDGNINNEVRDKNNNISIDNDLYNAYKITIYDTDINITLDKSFFNNNKILDNKPNYYSIHYHLSYEFFFIINDSIKIITEKKEYVFHNSIIIIPPFFKHLTVNLGSRYRFNVSFSSDNISKKTIYNQLLQCFSSNKIYEFEYNEKITFFIKNIANHLYNNTIYSNLQINSLLTLLFIDLLEIFHINAKTKTQINNQNYVYQIEYFINNFYKEDIDLSFLAKKLYLSTKQVSRIIKSNYNNSLNNLINEKKLSIALLLLQNTDETVSKIANEVNFQNESYFFVQFKKKYGVTPLQFRKTVKKT